MGFGTGWLSVPVRRMCSNGRQAILLPVCQSPPEKQLRWDSHQSTATAPPSTAPPVSAMPSWKLSLRRPSLPTPKSLVCGSQEGAED